VKLDKLTCHIDIFNQCVVWHKKPARATPWVYWQEEIKLDFHTYVAPRSFAAGWGVYITNLMQIAPLRVPKVSFKILILRLFAHLENHYKTRMHARIKLKLGTQNGCITANLRTNFSARFPKLWLIVYVKKDRFVFTPTG